MYGQAVTVPIAIAVAITITIVSLARLRDLDKQILAMEKIQILHVKGFQSNNKLEFT
jgi:hypothetical protein